MSESPTSAPAAPGVNCPYKNPALPIEKRVEDLLGRMTIEEKFWQLFMLPGDLSEGKDKYRHGLFGFQFAARGASSGESGQLLEYGRTGSARETARRINEMQRFFVEETRLGIPAIFFDEALHGLVRDEATAFPQAIGLAATWDTELMERVSTAIARETRSRGIRQILSPVLNIARDPRWGRVEETYGEDPFLASRMGVAFVRSFEKMGVVTTPKHFAANLGDGGRDSYPIHFSERLMHEVYLPAFKACIQEGGSTSVMTAYNSIDGAPCSSNPWLLRKVLKGEWGFDGFAISDACAVGGLLDLHHTVATREESAASAIRGGLDVIFQTELGHHVPLLRAFTEGMIDERIIADAVARVLRAKFRLGLFEEPYVDPGEAERWNGCPDHRELALEAARKSLVLLKNENKTLPFRKDLRAVAVIGVDAVEARLGGYSGPGNGKTSILDGIKEKMTTRTNILFAEGCGRALSGFRPIPPEFLVFDEDGEERPGLRGEYFNNTELSGEPALTRTDPKVDFWWTFYAPRPSLDQDWFSARWTGRIKAPGEGLFHLAVEGNDGFRMYVDGELLVDCWQKQSAPHVEIPYEFWENKSCEIRLEFRENFGNSMIRLLWDAGAPDVAARIEEAVDAAKQADAVVVVVGIEEGESRDRARLGLPGRQEEMILRIAATGRPVAVVLIGGSAVTMSNWIDYAPAVLAAWYPGDEGGNAVADALFGDYNPGGKLPITFPLSEAQLPLYYNHKPTGRLDDYMDLPGQPLFPFGCGLSYTSFEYEGLAIRPAVIKRDGTAKVTFTVRNTGDVAGEEVVQLYIRDLVASIAQPVMALKGFKRISLEPGESKEVCFDLTPEHLSMLNADMERVVEPGDFKIMIGGSSRDLRLRGFMRVSES